MARKCCFNRVVSVWNGLPERVVTPASLRVTWGKAPPFGDDLSLTYLFASTSEISYMYVTNDMLSIY